jgi:hypothetical protein
LSFSPRYVPGIISATNTYFLRRHYLPEGPSAKWESPQKAFQLINPNGLPFRVALKLSSWNDAVLRNDDPQPNGFVYDADGPSLGQTPAPPDGTILRRRTNFFQFAFIANGLTARLSANLNWYNRISIIFTGGAAQLSNDITGDNVSGTGTTNLSWNLQ